MTPEDNEPLDLEHDSPAPMDADWEDDAHASDAEDYVPHPAVDAPRGRGLWVGVAVAGLTVGIAGLIVAVVLARSTPPQVMVTVPPSKVTNAPAPSPATATGVGEVVVQRPVAGMSVTAHLSAVAEDEAQAQAAVDELLRVVREDLTERDVVGKISQDAAGVTTDADGRVRVAATLAAAVDVQDPDLAAQLARPGVEVDVVPRYGAISEKALAEARGEARQLAEAEVDVLATQARRKRGILQNVSQLPLREDGPQRVVVPVSVTYTLAAGS